jgi:hypothetical protein
MNGFKEFFALQEVIDAPSADQVIWQQPPQAGSPSKAIFRAGNFGYWISFTPSEANRYFADNRRAFAYSISFDAVRDQQGRPTPFHQLVQQYQQQNQQALANPAKPGKGANDPRKVPGASVTGSDYVPFVTPGNFSRTGIGATEVLGPVVAVVREFCQTVRPEVIQWIPADNKLQRMYKLLIKKFAGGQYTLVGDHAMLVRNDLLDALRPEVRHLHADDLYSDPEAFRLF